MKMINDCPKCSGVQGVRHARGCDESREESDALDGLPEEDINKTFYELNGLTYSQHITLILKNVKKIANRNQNRHIFKNQTNFRRRRIENVCAVVKSDEPTPSSQCQ